MKRPLVDLHTEIRAHERAYSEFQTGQKAAYARLAELPRRESLPRDPGMTPQQVAEHVADLQWHAPGSPATPALAILIGRRELKRFRAMDGAREILEVWLGGEETLCGVPLVVRKGAGALQIFTDIGEFDSAVRELPQPIAGPRARRRW